MQKAAKSKNAFHINEALNGIPLNTANHLTGHNLYNAKIREKLILLNNTSPTNEIAYQKLITFSNDLRNLIKNNPNMNLGQIASLIK